MYRSGSFIGISFVFITGLRTTCVQIPLNDDDEEGKEKREENTQRVKKGAHINNVPSVSAARITNKSSLLVFEGEKGVFMVQNALAELNFCEV